MTEMNAILNRYLIQHKSISIPGLGTIQADTIPASIDAAGRCAIPPSVVYRFDSYFDAPDKEFFSYLARKNRISDYDALRNYNAFAYTLRDQLNQQQSAVWEGLGTLVKDDTGGITLVSSRHAPEFIRDIPAEKLLRDDAEHKLLVGDRERTSSEMTQWFSEEPAPGRKRWWLAAVIIAVVSLLLAVIHLSTHGWNIGATGNQQTIRLKN
jgi:hypothetical protein